MRRQRQGGEGRCDARWAVGVALISVFACKSEAQRACASQFAGAQGVVMKVEAEDMASVSGSVAAVEAAIGTCKAAGSSAEVEELSRALGQLSSHRDRLQRRDEMLSQRKEIAPEELARLIRAGDPKCPRGQGYLHGPSGKRIVCNGPQPVDMPRPQAEEYFRGRGYKLAPGGSSAEVRFEFGAELLVFAYADAAGTEAPRCVTLYPAPDRSWQEATARVTGVAPARLKPNQPIRRSGGPVAFSVDESPEKVVARIGQCSG